MTRPKKDYDSSDKKSDDKGKPAKREAGDADEIACRCKEVSKKTLPELFRLMIKDLAFWKKTKARK